jgi:hypothetical protein
VIVLTAKRSDGEGGGIHVLLVWPTLAADGAITSNAARAWTAGLLLLMQREAERCVAGDHLIP